MSAYKAVIFDFDGVVVDSDPFSRFAFGEALKKKGILLTDEMYKINFAGRKLGDSLSLLLSPLGRTGELEEFKALKESYDSVYAEHVISYSDAVELIQGLKGKYRLAIATGSRKSMVEIGLAKFGLRDCFEIIVCAEDYGKGKPDPEVYVTALKKLGLRPEEAVVVEDTPSGIKAAVGAGIPCVAVAHTHPAAELSGASLVVEELNDSKITNLLRGIV